MVFSSRLLIAAVAIVAFSAPLCASAADPSFPINEQNASGEKGTATFTQRGDDVVVSVKMEGGNAKGPQPIHIHRGTCAHLNPTPFKPLTNVVGGSSTTTFEGTTIAKLTNSNVYSINVHKSPAEAKVYVACGRLRAAKP